jgi:heme-degrading monooxygenase HmoA
MFAVIFEVSPRPEAWNDYLAHAAALRPELVAIDGFIANERYASLHRPGWLVSLSIWRDEKALIRWRTHALHHDIQAKGRTSVFSDYHLRVGEIVADSEWTAAPPRQRLDATEVAPAKVVSLTERVLDRDLRGRFTPEGDVNLGRESPSQTQDAQHDRSNPDLSRFSVPNGDVFDSITRPGNGLYLRNWPDIPAATDAIAAAPGHHRVVQVIRDYGMFARTEAPQYFPAA